MHRINHEKIENWDCFVEINDFNLHLMNLAIERTL